MILYMATGVEYPLMRGLRTIIFALGMHDRELGEGVLLLDKKHGRCTIIYVIQHPLR